MIVTHVWSIPSFADSKPKILNRMTSTMTTKIIVSIPVIVIKVITAFLI